MHAAQPLSKSPLICSCKEQRKVWPKSSVLHKMRFNVFPSFPLYRALMNTHLQSGPALAGAGPLWQVVLLRHHAQSTVYIKKVKKELNDSHVSNIKKTANLLGLICM